MKKIGVGLPKKKKKKHWSTNLVIFSTKKKSLELIYNCNRMKEFFNINICNLVEIFYSQDFIKQK